MLGHRGASADAPENTLAAFALALAQGADGFELDVWRCATGEPVVIHDADARRTAGEPLPVRRSPLAALRRLDVGGWKGARWRGERVPLLAEVLDAFPRAVVNVELKSTGLGDPRLAAGVARVIRRARAGARCIVSSFDPLLLAAFRAIAPGVPAGVLVEEGQRLAWRERAARLLRAGAIHPQRTLVTPERMARWSGQGRAVNVWTADAGDEIERLARAGAAAIISNRPGEAREAVRRATGR